MMLGAEHGMSPDRQLDNKHYKNFELNTDKTQVQRPGENHAPLSRVLGERDNTGSVPAQRSYDQKKTRSTAPESDKTPVSLRKKPTEKLSLNFNPEEKEENVKNVSLSASEDLKKSVKGVSESISDKKEKKKPTLRATRPDPNL